MNHYQQGRQYLGGQGYITQDPFTGQLFHVQQNVYHVPAPDNGYHGHRNEHGRHGYNRNHHENGYNRNHHENGHNRNQHENGHNRNHHENGNHYTTQSIPQLTPAQLMNQVLGLRDAGRRNTCGFY